MLLGCASSSSEGRQACFLWLKSNQRPLEGGKSIWRGQAGGRETRRQQEVESGQSRKPPQYIASSAAHSCSPTLLRPCRRTPSLILLCPSSLQLQLPLVLIPKIFQNVPYLFYLFLITWHQFLSRSSRIQLFLLSFSFIYFADLQNCSLSHQRPYQGRENHIKSE